MLFDADLSAASTVPVPADVPSVQPGWNLIPDPTHKTRIIVRKSGVEMGHHKPPQPILGPPRRHDKRRLPAKKPLFSHINKPSMGMRGAPGPRFWRRLPVKPQSRGDYLSWLRAK